MSRRAPPKTTPTTFPSGDPSGWSVRNLKAFLQQLPSCNIEGVTEKEELVKLVRQYMPGDESAGGALSAPSASSVPMPTERDKRTAAQWATVRFKMGDAESEKDVAFLRSAGASQQPSSSSSSSSLLGDIFTHFLFHSPELTMNQIPSAVDFVHALSTFGGKSIERMVKSEEGSGGVCGKSLSLSDTVYRCLQCAADPTCIMCSECFFSSPCVNHPYKTSTSGGGMCDCGDPTAWESKSFCCKHKAPGDEGASPPTLSEMLAPEDLEWVPMVMKGSAGVLGRILLSLIELHETIKDVGTSRLATVASAMVSMLYKCAIASPAGRALVFEALRYKWESSAGDQDRFITPLDEIVRFDMLSIFTRGSQETNDLHALFRTVIAEPHSKLDIIRSLVRFSERPTARSRKERMDSVDVEAVQVLTVPWAVVDAMDPAKLQLGEGNTVLHRLLSGLLYGLSKAYNADAFPSDAKKDPHFGMLAAPDYPVLRVKEVEGVFDEMRTILHNLRYTISSSREVAGRMFVLSRPMVNAFCQSLEAAHFLGWIRRTDDAVDKYAFETADLSLALCTTMQSELGSVWGSMLRLLPAGGGGETTESSSASIILDEHYFKILQASRGFPNPPEGTKAQTLLFKSVLDRCGRKTAIGVGADSMLPPLPKDVEASMFINPTSSRLEFVWATAAQLLHSLSIVAYAQSVYGKSLIEPSPPLVRRVPGSESAISHTSRCLLRGASYTYSQPVARILAVLLHRFLVADANADDTLAADVAHRRLRTVLPDIAYLVGNASLVSLHHHLDAFIMMRVAASQIYNSLWRRDYFSCLRLQAVYDEMQTPRIKEVDHFLMQCLTACLDPWDVSVQMLDRFSYLPPLAKVPSSSGGGASSRSKKGDSFYEPDAIPLGYGSYLALVLSLVGDAVLSCTDQRETLRLRMLSAMAPRGPLLTSAVIELLGKGEEDSSGARQGEALSKEKQIEAVFAEVTTSERSKKGTVRRIKKEKALWAKIPPYAACWDMNARHAAIDSFTMAFPAPSMPAGSGPPQQQASYPYTVSDFPCPVVAPQHHPALFSSLRALLHSPMAVSTALFVVLQRALQCRYDVVPQEVLEAKWKDAPHKESVGFGSSLRECKSVTDGSAPEIVTALKNAPPAYLDVKEEDTLTAIDYLLLVLQDAKAITTGGQRRLEELGVSAAGLAEESVEGTQAMVDWSVYREYLKKVQSTYHTESPTAASSCFNFSDVTGLCPIDWSRSSCAKSVLNATTNSGPLVCLPDLAGEEINTFTFQVNRDTGRKPQTYTAPTPPTPCSVSDGGACCELSSWFVQGGFTLLSAIRALEIYFGFGLKEHGDTSTVDAPSCSKEAAAIYAVKLKEIQNILRNEPPKREGDVSKEAEDESAARDAANAAERLAKIKEKQRLLAERMKKKQAKVGAALGVDTSSPTTVPSAAATANTSATVGGPAPNLHEGIVMHGASLECCFCRAGEEDGENLMYLAHAAASDHITAIVHGPQRDPTTGEILLAEENDLPQRLNASTLLCGHAAHLTCFAKHFAFLQDQRGAAVRELLLQRRGYRGMRFLGGAEIVCPLCSRVCSALSAIPRLMPETTTALTSQSTATIDAVTKVIRAVIVAPHPQSTDGNAVPGYLSEWVAANLQAPNFKAAVDECLQGFSTTGEKPEFPIIIGRSCVEAFISTADIVGPISNLWRDTLGGFCLSAEHRPLREGSFEAISAALTKLVEDNKEPKPSSSSATAAGSGGKMAHAVGGMLEAAWVLADGLRAVTEGLLKVGGGRIQAESNSPVVAEGSETRIMQPPTLAFIKVLSGVFNKNGSVDFQNRHLSALITTLVSFAVSVSTSAMSAVEHPEDFARDLSIMFSVLVEYFSTHPSAGPTAKRAAVKRHRDEVGADSIQKSIAQLKAGIGSSYCRLDAVELASLATVAALVEGVATGVVAAQTAAVAAGREVLRALADADVGSWSAEDRSRASSVIDSELRGLVRPIIPRCIESSLAAMYGTADGGVSSVAAAVVKAASTPEDAPALWSTAAPLAILKACVTGVPILPAGAPDVASTNPLVLPVTGDGVSLSDLHTKALALTTYVSRIVNTSDSCTASSKMLTALLSSQAPPTPFHLFVPRHLGEFSVESVLALRRRDFAFLPSSYAAYSQLVSSAKSTCGVCSATKIKGGLLCLRCKKLMCLRGTPPELLAHVMDYDKPEEVVSSSSPAVVGGQPSAESESTDDEWVDDDDEDWGEGSFGDEESTEEESPSSVPPTSSTSPSPAASQPRIANEEKKIDGKGCACGGGGVGVCVLPKISAICVILGNQERVAQMPPIYVDRFGEIDDGMVRGDPLSLSEGFYVADFLLPHVMNSWDHDTVFLSHAWKHGMSTL